MPFISQYPSLPGGIQAGDVLLVGRGGMAFQLPALTQGFPLTNSGLALALTNLIQSGILPTAPSAAGPTLWLMDGVLVYK